VFYCCEFADQFPGRFPFAILLFFSSKCFVKRRRRERTPFTLFELCWRNRGYVVEGRLDFATEMAVVGERRRWIWRVSCTTQAKKENEWIWIQGVQEAGPQNVVP
jgi:hypothetical protein